MSFGYCIDRYLALVCTLLYVSLNAHCRMASMTESIQIQLKKGALELCVLALLARRESYAYEIASTLADGVGMGEGTIYPLMRRMQNDGLVDTRLVRVEQRPAAKILSPHLDRPRGFRGAEARVAGVHGFGQHVAGRKLMNRDAFLCSLSDGLEGLPPDEVDDILADYVAYFDEARASGRSEEEVAAALGDPGRLARELRAESGLRRWENHRSLGNSAAVLLAIGGLAAVDILFLLPLLFAVMLAMFVMGLVIFVLGIVGIGLLLSLFKVGHFASIAAMVLRACAGIGLIAGSMGCVALLALALNGAVKMLGNYARLHYRLLKPEQRAA